MFDHVSLGVADVPRSKRFYDQALEPLGYACLSEGKNSLGYGCDAVRLWIGHAERPVAPEPASGLHFCFVAATREGVDRFHAAAIAAGGKDNGKPGLRTSYGDSYYAAFVTDPDGYRLEAYCGQ
jgi:catechol 2,3-dioxygenase-like lactoylglutathione lyase family enzyme